MLPEALLKFHRDDMVQELDTGKTDGTVMWPGGLATSTGWEMKHHRRFCLQFADTPGVAGTNTYTVEGSLDRSTWVDKTNDWFGSASFTTSQVLDLTSPTLLKYVRLKRVRTGDAANSDGGSVVDFRMGD